MNTTSTPDGTAATAIATTPEDFDELDAILDDLRTRYDETPQWEFCEGFMAALVCCRRPIPIEEFLPVLLAIDDTVEAEPGEMGSFASPEQAGRFLTLWQRRWDEVAAALKTPVEALDDDAAYAPEVMDVRGAIATLSEEERAQLDDEILPAFAQVWSLGFMYAVEAWPEEWEAPRDKELAKWHDSALEAIVALTEDDDEEPTLSALSEDGPPSVSVSRLNAYGEALWAVYDLHEIWSQIGPRVLTVQRDAPKVGRNDPCPCGSGQKYKKCCGAAASTT